MSTESEGRGLPVGFAWIGDAAGVERLMGTIAGECLTIATAFPNGGWRAGVSSRHNVAQPRPGESAGAAALREAEAALWRCDGFGVGEVRGVVLPIGEREARREVLKHGAIPSLAGLPGMWTVKAVRPVEGGVEVDAVRSPFDTVADLEAAQAHAAAAGDAMRASPEPACQHPMNYRAPVSGDGWICALCNADVEAPPAAEPVPFVPLGVDGITLEHEVRLDAVIAACTGGEPAPREPSAPTDGELARLLPGLRRTIDFLAEENPGGIAPHTRALRIEAHEDARRACELLLAERERMAGELAAAEECADAWANRAATGIATVRSLRARVAELEAEPPPDTVAALLAKVEARAKEADRDAAQFSGREQEIDASYEEGRSVGLGNAAGMIRDALVPLAAPSPLDRAVADVVAFPPYAGTLADVFDRIGEALDLVGDESTPEGTRRALAKVARVALAGMLACDAAKEPT